MKGPLLITSCFLAGVLSVGAQVLDFNTVSGVNSATDGSIDGWVVADQYGGTSYSGYVGELAMIFADPSGLPVDYGSERGAFVGDTGEVYDGMAGLVVFCIDSATPFYDSTSPLDTVSYQPMNFQMAEQRYLAEGVDGYGAGGLLRAAYLLETYYDVAHAGGDLGAAALQSAIWEVLTDSDPSLVPGSGSYSLRTIGVSSLLAQRSNEMISLTDQWFADAIANDWGGGSYDPANRVAFWLDPSDISANQSVISLNPEAGGLVLVPEPGVFVMCLLGAAGLFRRTRTRREN